MLTRMTTEISIRENTSIYFLERHVHAMNCSFIFLHAKKSIKKQNKNKIKTKERKKRKKKKRIISDNSAFTEIAESSLTPPKSHFFHLIFLIIKSIIIIIQCQ